MYISHTTRSIWKLPT